MSKKIIASGLLVGCLVSGCSSPLPGYPAPASSSPAAPFPASASATRGGEMGALTARGVVDALDGMGLAVANPVDTTAQECPDAGCEQSIVTDTLRIKSFATTAGAETYAAGRGLFQVETIVVAFAPPVPEADAARYRAQIQALVRQH